MRSLTVAIDIDDVLAESAAGFIEFSNQRWGTSLTVEDYDEHWAKMWQVDASEVEQRAHEFHTSSAVRGYGHIGGAYEVLKRLAQNHRLVIATSRRLQVQQDSLLWIEEHFPGVFTTEAVYFAGIWDDVDGQSHLKTKADLVDQINADILVDDQLKHCVAVADSGRHALLFGDYSWNQTDTMPKNIVRCRSWKEVEIEIERIASL